MRNIRYAKHCVRLKKRPLSKKERLGMMDLSTGSKPNTIKEALLLDVWIRGGDIETIFKNKQFC
jgi:hypothetical protein